jgi:hypothetical protein
MALEGGEVNAGNEVYYLPVGLYSTSTYSPALRVVRSPPRIEHDSTEQSAPPGAGFAGGGAAAQQRERRALHLFSGKKDTQQARGRVLQLVAA